MTTKQLKNSNIAQIYVYRLKKKMLVLTRRLISYSLKKSWQRCTRQIDWIRSRNWPIVAEENEVAYSPVSIQLHSIDQQFRSTIDSSQNYFSTPSCCSIQLFCCMITVVDFFKNEYYIDSQTRTMRLWHFVYFGFFTLLEHWQSFMRK